MPTSKNLNDVTVYIPATDDPPPDWGDALDDTLGAMIDLLNILANDVARETTVTATAAAQVLTSTSLSSILYVPSGAFNATLDTSFVKGETLHIGNTSGTYAVTIKANDGSTILALGNQVATVIALQATPTTNSHWSVDYVDFTPARITSLETNAVLKTGDQTIAGVKTFSSTITSTLATGTSPLTVASTTVVTNLNADQVDGADLDTTATLGTSDVKIPSQKAVKTYVDAKGGSFVRYTAGNAQGSTKTSVIRYTTAAESIGTDLTYVGSATDGDSFAVNVSGIYAVSACALVSVGANTLEIRVGALDNVVGGAKARNNATSGGTSYQTAVHWTGYVAAGSSIWIACGVAPASSTDSNQVSIARVA